MLRRIVVPLDGSPFGETALPVAVRLADRSGANLTLVKVHEPIMALVPATDLPATAPDDLDVRAAEQTYLDDTAARIGPLGSGPVGVELLDGAPARALTEWINRVPPDLVVMATHGRNAVSRFWIGSVADYLVRHSAVPVLLIRPETDRATTADTYRFQHGLVALDRSEQALEVLGPVAAIALAAGSRLTLLHVVEPILGVEAIPPYPLTLPEEYLASIRAESQGYLDEAAQRLRTQGIEVETKLAVRMGIAPAILDELEVAGADFIAMTTHGAGGLKRLILGSVADKVIRGATSPVLVVGPRTGATGS